jgi:C-terminal processing protease CtpA/Prc
MQHKTGTAHNSFSELNAQYLEPAKGIRWQKKVCVLTNRSTYSAANEFVKYMKTLGATIIGDKTGGGAGMPFSSELPNGWGVRFSACPMYDIQRNSTEFGIDPTIKVDIQSSDFQKQVDTIIETAFSII